MQGIRLALEEVADRAIAFSDPRALVQEPRGGQKRLEINLYAASAERLQARYRF